MSITPQRFIIRSVGALIAISASLYLIITLGKSIKAGSYTANDVWRIIFECLAFIMLILYSLNKFIIGSKSYYFKLFMLFVFLYYLTMGIYDAKQSKYILSCLEILIFISALALFKA